MQQAATLDEQAEVQLLACEDFKFALQKGGALEAAATLNRYLADLRSPPAPEAIQLAAAFRAHAAPAVAAAAGGAAAAQPLQPLLDLERLLLSVVGASVAATQEVQAVWDDAAAALLYGQEGEGPEVAVDRLKRAFGGSSGGDSTQLAAQLLAGDRTSRLPPPASHQQVRSLAACLLHLHLFPAELPGAPAGLADQLAAAAAPPWLGRDLRQTQQQMGAAFEAFVGVMQCHTVQQRLDNLTHRSPAAVAAAHAAAMRFLLLFRPPLPAAVDLWWAHFAAVLHALVAQAQPGSSSSSSGGSGAGSGGGTGAAALQRPVLRHLIRALCGQETAHMVVQLVLAHPAYQVGAEGASAATAAAAGAAVGSRKRAAAGGAAVGRRRKGRLGASGEKAEGESGGSAARAAASVRKALGVAAELLAHDVPAFLAGCCELLRPEANAALQARVEALAAMGRAATAFLAEQDDEEDENEAEEESWAGDDERQPGSSRAAATAAEPRATPAQRLWQPAALEQLLFVARRDPSVRVRREAVKLLGCAVGMGVQQEGQLVRAVAQRCRDRDEGVRREAFALLARFPRASLERCLQLTDWQTVLDCGLAGPLPGSTKGGARSGAAGGQGVPAPSSSKHAASIQGTARHLILRFLGLDPDGEAAEVMDSQGQQQDGSGTSTWEREDEEEVEEEEGRGQLADERAPHPRSTPAWMRKLRALQPLLEKVGLQPYPGTGAAAAAAVADHLQAAWMEALEQALQPEQLAALG